MSRLLCNASPQPVLAGLVRAIIERREELDPWLEFPQTSCSHWFGPQHRPLPIGALYLLWERDECWRKPCPECNGELRGISCAGSIDMLQYEFICLGCERLFTERQPPSFLLGCESLRALEATPFACTGGLLDGAHGSEGRDLLDRLGIEYEPVTSLENRGESINSIEPPVAKPTPQQASENFCQVTLAADLPIGESNPLRSCWERSEPFVLLVEEDTGAVVVCEQCPCLFGGARTSKVANYVRDLEIRHRGDGRTVYLVWAELDGTLRAQRLEPSKETIERGGTE
jgi:hypothetical protein